MHRLYCLAVLLLFCGFCGAQRVLQYPFKKDTSAVKRFGRASSELLLAQVMPWSWNYFVRKADFAHIGIKSISNNIKFRSWEWDDNNFTTNQFSHPYHGNLYFNSFRTNGYSFWQSAPAALAGSYIWETAGETHHPAINDFINTSLGGIAIGEISYRLANQVVDNTQRGLKRQLMEVSGFIINPINGFNRIIDGKWGRYHKNAKEYQRGKLLVDLNLGTRRYSEVVSELVKKGRNETYGSISVIYGNPFTDHKRPFDSYNGLIEMGSSDSANFNLVRIEGTLYGWQLKQCDTVPQHVAVITMNYDYYKNTAFLFGAQSFNLKLLSSFKTGKKSQVNTQVGIGTIVLGAVPDKYLYYGEGRNYDYGPGLNLITEATYQRKKISVGISYRGSWFHTMNGSKSSYYLHTITQDLKIVAYKKFSLQFEWGVFSLNGFYKGYEPNVNKIYPYLRSSYCYRFSL